uniref:Venom lipase n=1 Tax=Lethocerus distinctifemur TaxID=280095 RepID=A0A2K8JR95_9HEMI|nr:venom lipase [Lethocerus distinctifemur]
MNALAVLVLFALNVAYIAGEDIEDLMLRNLREDSDIPMPYGLVDPEEHVKFWLHAKGHEGYELLNIDQKSETHIRFHPKKKTKVIIHGWMVNGEEKFCRTIRLAYLEHHDYNIITVDWSMLSKTMYNMAKAYVAPVGEYVAEMLEYLVKNYHISLADVHIIGHSLGAHVAGAAGSSTRSGKIGRITGLDPAAILFGDNDGLNAADAKFVDVIHTSILGLTGSLGQADFYPNGGGRFWSQPGCGFDIAYCTHTRAYLFFAESIGNKHSFPSLRCEKYKQFLEKQCEHEIVYMGEHVSHKAKGKYFLVTNSEPPFSITLPHELYDKSV